MDLLVIEADALVKEQNLHTENAISVVRLWVVEHVCVLMGTLN